VTVATITKNNVSDGAVVVSEVVRAGKTDVLINRYAVGGAAGAEGGGSLIKLYKHKTSNVGVGGVESVKAGVSSDCNVSDGAVVVSEVVRGGKSTVLIIHYAVDGAAGAARGGSLIKLYKYKKSNVGVGGVESVKAGVSSDCSVSYGAVVVPDGACAVKRVSVV